MIDLKEIICLNQYYAGSSSSTALQGKTFTGIGPTPSIAKNIAAEAAVHHIATIMSSDPTEEEIQTGRAFEDR